MPNHRLLIAALTAAATWAAAPAAAQVNFELVPRIGVYTPLAPFGPDAELQSSLAFGVGGELVLAMLPVGLRVNLDHASTTEIRRRDPTEALLGTAQITAVVGSLVVRPFAAAPLFQPYFMAGGGAKFYDISLEPGVPDLAGMAGRSSRATVQVGGGVDLRLGVVSVVLEVANYMNSLATAPGQSRTQHDAFGTLGIRVAMF